MLFLNKSTGLSFLFSALIFISFESLSAQNITPEIIENVEDGEDQLLFSPIPDWVERADIPKKQTVATKGTASSIALLNYQHKITEKGGIRYTRRALRVSEDSAVQSAGTVTITWVANREEYTLHHLHILRGQQTIDLIERGQEFQYFRREANLEKGLVDGQITASLQIEDLRVGDIIDLAVSVYVSYEPIVGHYQYTHSYTAAGKADRIIQRVIWPKNRKVFIKHGDDLPPYQHGEANGFYERHFLIDNFDFKAMPKNLPQRLYYERISQISTFESWQDVADSFRPVFNKASIIPESGSLRDAVEGLRDAPISEMEKIERALDMVQNDVRYVANSAGLGGYIPESAQSVWDSKFGDCKGKTVLLIAILRELGHDAAPVLSASRGFEALNEFNISAIAFNHVFTRLKLNGKSYWLDGTRRRDSTLATLPAQFHGYVLPLEVRTKITYLNDRKYRGPQNLNRLTIDISGGINEIGTFRYESIYFDDAAKRLANGRDSLTKSEKAKIISNYAESKQGRDANIDKIFLERADDELTAKLIYEGTISLPLDGGDAVKRYYAYALNIGRSFSADRKTPKYKDYPSTSSPRYTVEELTIIYPEDYGSIDYEGATFDKTIGPARYIRTASIDNNIFKGRVETQVEYIEYTQDDADIWDSESDKIFDDKIYVRFIPQGSPAIANKLNSKQAIALAYDIENTPQNVGKIRAILDPLIKNDRNNLNLLEARGNLLATNDPLIAERDFLRILAIQSNRLTALEAAAKLYLAQDDKLLARKMLDKILKRDENHPWALEQRKALGINRDADQDTTDNFEQTE